MPTTLVNVFSVDPADQQELLQVLADGTDTVMRHRPGFVSVELLASHDGTRVVNVARWRSENDLQAALADPAGHAVVQRALALADASPHVCSVASTHTA